MAAARRSISAQDSQDTDFSPDRFVGELRRVLFEPHV